MAAESVSRHPEPSVELTPEEYRRKDLVLAQSEPAKIAHASPAIVLKQSDVFMLADERGDVPWERPHAFGLFTGDCRFLDGFVLTLDGLPPTPLSASDTRGFEAQHDLANPDLKDARGRVTVPKNTVGIRRDRLIRAGVLQELLSIRNFGLERARFTVSLRIRAEFEDMFTVKGFVSGPRGAARPPRVVGRSRLELSYDGVDGVRRSTVVAFSPPADRLEPDGATFDCDLAPGAIREVAIAIAPGEGGGAAAPPEATPETSPEIVRQWNERIERRWLAGATEITSSNPLFDLVMRRALVDLRVLHSILDGQRFFAAGVPWFVTLFGRDAAVTAIQTLPYGPTVAAQTLRLLARYQARTYDAYRDAEPGKILHELRRGELARASAIPQSPAYYGSVDATLLFLILLAEYVRWSGDFSPARELRSNVDAALAWIDRDADHDGDGYIDYIGEYPSGLINQGWKDSGNAILNADGSLPKPPIAVCEVQAYCYRAWRQTATLLRGLGDSTTAATLDARADALQARFERDFWSDELGCYVLARQAGGRPVAVVSSNAGQVLWGGIASPAHADAVVRRLMRDDMFSGWGIRTLSSEAVAYNPMSYHAGSVWPHDNGILVSGFCRYGHKEAALRVFDALFAAAASFRHYRLPELYSGYAREDVVSRPVRYPVACSPQAWAAGALPHALWNLLGVSADPDLCCLHLVRPRLPDGVDWLRIKGLRVRDAVVDLRFEREGTGDGVHVDFEVRQGRCGIDRVEAELSPEGFGTSAPAA